MANAGLVPDYEEKKKRRTKGKHTVVNEYILFYIYQFFFIQILEEAVLHFQENKKRANMNCSPWESNSEKN